jgi:hypothetical protein
MTAAVEHDLTAAIRRVEARSSRSRQKELGASEIGQCRRRTAYRLAGTAETNGSTGLQATLGAWIHKGALAVLRKEYGALIEVRLASDVIRGHADAVYPGVLEDVKTKGRFVYAQVVDKGPRLSELFQTHIYGWMLRRGYSVDRRKGYPEPGKPWPVDTVRLRFVDRDTGANHVHEQPYDPALTAEALGWLADVLEKLEAGGPENVARDGHGPEVSPMCDYCPFLDACWGPPLLGPGARSRQSLQVRNDVDVELALAEYARGRALAAEGDAIKKRERKYLDGAQSGVYGGNELSWSESRPKLVPDLDAMIDVLEGMDVPVPMKWTAGGRTIGVRPAKQVMAPEG